jgi:hypothetical protein
VPVAWTLVAPTMAALITAETAGTRSALSPAPPWVGGAGRRRLEGDGDLRQNPVGVLEDLAPSWLCDWIVVRILVVEDEPKMARLIARGLREGPRGGSRGVG